MHPPLYRQALSHSWRLAWQHKSLWLFGLFAAFLGQMGLMELLSKVGFAASDYALYPAWLALPRLFKTMAPAVGELNFPLDAKIWFIWLLVIFAGMALLLIFVSVCSQGALIQSAAQSVKKKTLPDTSEAWRAGTRHFWRLFFINLIKKALMVLLAVFVGWGTLAVVVNANALEVAIFLLLFILAVVVGIVLSFLAIYAAGYVVVEEYPLFKAIESAWNLFLKHWLVSIEVGLVVLALNVLLGIVALFGFLVFFFPTLITWLIAVLTLNSALWTAGLAVGTLLFVLFVIFLGSVFAVFTTTVWTYLFMKMHKEGIVSRVLHLLSFKK